jgi:hypothetical protein
MRTLIIALALSLTTASFAQAPPAGDRMEQRAEREAEVLEWMRAKDPGEADRMERLKTTDPERYRMKLTRVARLMKASDSDPEMFERRQRLKEIHAELQGLSVLNDDDKRVAKVREEQVRALVDEAFELRMEAMEAKIASMEAKLEEAREKLAEARASREERVDGHVEKVLSGEMPERRGR